MTLKYKLQILAEVEKCTQPGQIGSLLRREGLYSSNLTTWRKQRDEGQLQGLNPKKRGRKAKPVNPLARRAAELERETQQLRKKLKKAELIIDFQKKCRRSWRFQRKPTKGATRESRLSVGQ